MSHRSVFDTIRLSHREIREILAGLEVQSSFDETNSRRRTRRWSLAGRKVLITLASAEESQRHFVSAARDLSSTGLSFLHGGFVHNGTKVLVTLLTTKDNSPCTIPSTIVRCRHLHQHLHDVGVKFDQTIDPRSFIDFGDEHVFTLERIDIAGLSGTLLVVEDSLMFQKLIASYFAGSKLRIEYVSKGSAALRLVDQGPDMIFVDYHLPDLNGLEFIRQARGSGYAGPIVVLTGDTTPGLRREALQAGANELLVKPCPPSVLHQAVAEYMLARPGAELGTPSAECKQKARGHVLEYINELHGLAEEITSSMKDEGAIEAIRDLATHVRATASDFGFDTISTVASEALTALEASGSITESKAQMQRLADACRRAAMKDLEASKSDSDSGRSAA